jgi:hypothetical protein
MLHKQPAAGLALCNVPYRYYKYLRWRFRCFALIKLLFLEYGFALFGEAIGLELCDRRQFRVCAWPLVSSRFSYMGLIH